MRQGSMPCAKPLAGALALFLVLAWVVPPVAATEVRPAAVKAPLTEAAMAKVAAAKPSARAFQTADPGTTSDTSRSFLRSPAGVVAVVLMAAGVGYAVYSANHDRKPVKSPIR